VFYTKETMKETQQLRESGEVLSLGSALESEGLGFYWVRPCVFSSLLNSRAELETEKRHAHPVESKPKRVLKPQLSNFVVVVYRFYVALARCYEISIWPNSPPSLLELPRPRPLCFHTRHTRHTPSPMPRPCCSSPFSHLSPARRPPPDTSVLLLHLHFLVLVLVLLLLRLAAG
jgi:hypothetical protein